ncbi:MAG TPA: hypothetical protein VGE07_18230 [Herpetosiphonaceae bacterium]
MSKHRERLYWAVIVVLIVVIGTLGVRLSSLSKAERTTYSALTDGVHSSWRRAQIHLTVAIDPAGSVALGQPERLSPARALELAERDLREAELASRTYSAALTRGIGEFPVSDMIPALMTRYADALGDLREQFADTGSITPAMEESLTLMRNDLELFMATLPYQMLMEADPPTIGRLLDSRIRQGLTHPAAREMLGTGK